MKGFEDATPEKIGISLQGDISDKDVKFIAEVNLLEVYDKLPKLTSDVSYLGILLRDGDNELFWKSSIQTSLHRPVWAFEVNNFYRMCNIKGINKIAEEKELSKRLEGLLGLKGNEEHHSIILIKLETKYLFRAAYVLDVKEKLTQVDKGKVNNINSAPNVIKEFFWKKQQDKVFPWTRLGYTYDWMGGDTDITDTDGKMIKPYIGVGSFIILHGNELLEYTSFVSDGNGVKEELVRSTIFKLKEFFEKEALIKMIVSGTL